MSGTEQFAIDQKPAWCPGCGDFGILNSLKATLTELGYAPHRVMLVSGIGQSSKLPHYLKCNVFNGLHGRSLPVAEGIKLANHEMLVIDVTGDGDGYGEGGNHLIHAARRNLNIKHFVHNNQIYGLTKGQPSPTTAEGTAAKNLPFGELSEPLNPLALAIALDISFVGRGFAGDIVQLKELMKAAITHKGYALLDILQPCVTFNKVNTYAWYRQRAYKLEPEYDPTDRVEAFRRSLEWGERIPTGIIYKSARPLMEERMPVLAAGPLMRQPFSLARGREILKELVSS